MYERDYKILITTTLETPGRRLEGSSKVALQTVRYCDKYIIY
jgi:hypothetical protein